MKIRKEEDEKNNERRNQEEEEEEEEEEENEGKTVVVGIRLDAESRELLTWALVKVALPGDRVVAVHVLPSSATTTTDGKPGALLSLAAAFDSMLAVYEGFCHLKQIDLKLKICRSSSLRKALVREAHDFAATTLILGVNKSPRAIGSSATSIAKYCAKKLSRNCSVLAVNNGKIVFQREASVGKEKRGDGQLASKIFSKLSDSDSVTAIQGQGESEASSSVSSPNCSDVVSQYWSSCESIDVDDISMLTGALPSKSCPICEPASVLPCSSNKGNDEPVSTESNDGEPSEQVQVQKLEVRTVSNVQIKHGWSLLWRALRNDWKNGSERLKVSTVESATQLPSQYSESLLVRSDCKPMKSDSHARTNSNIESHTSFKGVELPKELESLQKKYSSVCKAFSYKEIMDATSNFSSEKLIGKGGNSKVYKGCFSDGKELAVKILKPSENVLKEFISEIEIINTLHHKNIISLFGFCFEKDNLILVFDFLSRGSLGENLHGEKEKSPLTWVVRYKVAVGLAEALEYLHVGGSGQPVIHRDVKSSNILLSDDFEPKLSDFGFATNASSIASQITCSDIAGTFGYLAPEYFMYGKVSEKIDVYAFGVVLLELLSGREPIITGCPKGQESLVMWAKPILQSGKAKDLVDPSLCNAYDSDQMERMVLAASLCIQRVPRFRPQIAMVQKLLRGDDEAVKWARSQLSSSEEPEGLDDDATCLNSNIQSHLTLALLDVEDDSSISSMEQTVDFTTANSSLEDILPGRWSHSSSFD